jgi:DsbC/DsbD-like thiol-disulfide interchange protein
MRAQANWLVCNEERCIPEEAELALTLPVGPGEPSVWAKALERTRSTLPVKAEGSATGSSARQAGLLM